MKLVLMAVVMLLLIVPSLAQAMGGGGGRHHRGGEKKAEQHKPTADEKAYKSSLDKLPDRPYDPWRTVRGK